MSNTNFDYFDQYQDINIDLTHYLKNISNSVSGASSAYTYNFSNLQPVVTPVKNLFTLFEVISQFQTQANLITAYTINDNETPDLISNNFYGTTDFWWIIVVFNNITNMFSQWPLNQNQLIDAAQLMYSKEGKYSYNTYYNFIHAKNESLRNIILPQTWVLTDIVWAYRQATLANTSY